MGNSATTALFVREIRVRRGCSRPDRRLTFSLRRAFISGRLAPTTVADATYRNRTMSRLRAGHETMRLPLGRRLPLGVPHVAGSVATVLVLLAIAAALGPGPRWSRASAAGAFVALAALASSVLGRRRQPAHGWLVSDESGLHRVQRELRATLVDWAEPFGLTVLASADRATILLALTSPRATRFVPASVRDAEDAAAAPNVLDHATTAALSDLRAHDDAALSAADAEKLFAEIGRRSPASMERVYLSDAMGEPVVLDRGELRVGARRIDLQAPLEWRASLFQERGAHAASVCQATWVHQGDVEIVLVAPLPADGGWMGDADVAVRAAGGGAAVKRSVARDMRLIQASASEAPPRDARHAIDRVFMLPLRRALDLAPRASRVAAPPPRPMPEGRA
jgi:hypothetical protein